MPSYEGFSGGLVSLKLDCPALRLVKPFLYKRIDKETRDLCMAQ